MFFLGQEKSLNNLSIKSFSLGIDWEDMALISYKNGIISNSNFSNDFIKETEYLLELLAKINLKCTFFAQAQTAKKYPYLLKLINDSGHSVGSHGLNHIARQKLSRNEFLIDCIDSKKIIEDILQNKIKGYRSPLLSISRNLYFESLSILKEAGYEYDSSIPIHNLKKLMKTLRIVNVSQFPIKIYPLTSFTSPLISFNLAGGSTWRVLPSFLTSLILESKLTSNNTSFYLHPYEFGAKINPHRVTSSKSSKIKILLKSMRWNLNKKAIEKVLVSIAKSNNTKLINI